MTDPREPAFTAAAPPHPVSATAPVTPLTAEQDKMWASFAHLGGVLWFLPSLIVWLVFEGRGRLTESQSREALNWQLTWLIAWAVSLLIGAILGLVGITGFALLLFGLLTPWLLYVVNLVFSVLGFVRVNSGGVYRYPVSLRIIR